MKKIIAFGHQKYVGKDTLIKFCIDILRPKLRAKRIVRRGFADKVYDICHIMYSWAGFQPRTYYADHPYAKKNVLANGKTVRDLLIEIGTPVMRAYDDNVWINAALKTDDFDILFVSDLRFPNEFEAIEKLGGTLIRITRPDLPAPTDIADTALNGWEDRWHDLVENNDGLNKLHAEAERIVDRYILNS
jgi:hypothetical protein